jgi:hypothetical protein
MGGRDATDRRFAETPKPVAGDGHDQATAPTTCLLDQPIAEEDMQTTSLTTYPHHGGDTEDSGQPSIVAYQASVSVTVRAGDLEQASSTVDGATLVLGDAFLAHPPSHLRIATTSAGADRDDSTRRPRRRRSPARATP